MARVARVHGANEVAPLLRRLGHAAGRAGVAPLVAARVAVRPASGRYARARRAGPDEVGVNGRHGLHQHRAARPAHDVNARRVRAVLLEHVLDHLRDGLRVAAAVVLERHRRSHVPAIVPRVVRQDQNEALRIGGGLRHRDVADLPGSRRPAGVARDVDGRLGRDLVRHVDVHLHVARHAGRAPRRAGDHRQRRCSRGRNTEPCNGNEGDRESAKGFHGRISFPQTLRPISRVS